MERDAIIIGGGPAGAVAAWRFAIRGWDVVLVERREDGADKCCGHCLHPQAFRVLDAMGCGDAVRRASTGRTLRGRVLMQDDLVVVNDSFAAGRHGDGGVIVQRRTLDPLLRCAAAMAGADIRCGTSARIESLDGGGARVSLRVADGPEETIAAKLLVGADGVGSAVARMAGLVDGARVGRKFGIGLDVITDAPTPELDETVSMFVADGGYLGVVRERGDRLHCGALVSADAPMPTRPLEAIGWFVDRSPILRSAMGSAWQARAERIIASGPMPWRTTARTAPGVALVGDAAGYVEPFTGEGMRWAIESSWMLADAIGDGRWDAAARERYECAWRDAVGAMHARCDVVARLAASPRLLAGIGAARRIWPTLGDRAMGGIVRKLVPR